jgi:Predicted ICC-like phosphoesterases
VTFDLLGEKIQLLPQKAMFLRKWKTLIIADLHFGKINHFRKSGIPVPGKANDRNAEMLIECIQESKAERIIFLGDLFHSHYNHEWEVVGQIRKHFTECDFELILGNHDILSAQQYERHKMHVVTDKILGPFYLTHEPIENGEDNQYNIAGHIHPGVRLIGTAKQSLTLPCFYFGKKHALLPAFGSFTGLALISPKKDDKIFAIAEGKIMELNYA